MYSVIPHLNCWAVIAVGSQNLSALLLCMNPYLCHLPVELDDHGTKKVWGRESTVSCHFVDCIKTFNNSMKIELHVHDSVVFVNRPLLGHDKAPADWATHLVPKFTKK
jgi:hypothetical protein